MKFLRVHLLAYAYSKPVCATAKWGVLLTCRVVRANPLIGLGSLPPRDTVFTHYNESASPFNFSPVRKLNEHGIERTFALTAGGFTGVSPSANETAAGLVYLKVAGR